MRLIRAVRELNAEHGTGIRVIALHTEAERRATFVRAADEAVLLRETGAGSPVPRPRGAGPGAARQPCRRRLGRLGLRRGGPGVRRAVRRARRHLRRAVAGGHAAARAPRSRPKVARRAGRRAGRGVERWPGRRDRGRPPARRRRSATRSSSSPAAAGEGGASGSSASEAELEEALERTAGRGGPHVRRPGHLHGAPGRGRPARRGAGHRRPARHGLGARCPRLLGAAAQPEGARGVQLAGADRRAGPVAARVLDRAGEGRRLRRGRHRRVPLPARREAVHVPRGQHPAAGRAPGDRGDHRPRPGQAAAARGRGRPARGRVPGRQRARDRGAAQRRGRRAGLRPGARSGRADARCRPAPACGSTPASASATSSRRCTTR